MRRSLVTRGLPARLAEGTPPILTPNAGIIKLQGSKDLTVQAVEARADEIFTSEGVKIISVTPESGRVSIAVEQPVRQVLHTEQVLLSYMQAFATGNLGEKLFVGTREENGQPLLLDPFNQPHTLIAGITGSGKSVLVQNLILTIAATRSADGCPHLPDRPEIWRGLPAARRTTPCALRAPMESSTVPQEPRLILLEDLVGGDEPTV